MFSETDLNWSQLKNRQRKNQMTNLEKSTALIEAMGRVVLYSKLMQQYFGKDNEVSFEDYKEYEGRVEEAKEIIFNLAMGE